ncbi:hypothetical protein Mgra_00007594, partial [Meloidogyne graminicola]
MFYFCQLMIPFILLGYSLFTANFSIAEHSKIDELTNKSSINLLNNNDNDETLFSTENHNKNFEASEIRPKRDEDDDTPLHDDEEIEKSDISLFNTSSSENSKEKNTNNKRSIISNSSEKNHQKHKRQAEKNESESNDDVEEENKQINSPTIMTTEIS